MNKQKKTTADNIGNTNNRANRWRKIAEKQISNLHVEQAAILGALAELNEFDPIGFVMCNLCEKHGIDADAPSPSQQYYLMVDAKYDNAPRRTRTAYDVGTVKDVIQFLTFCASPIRANEAVSLIRRYGRKGDVSIGDITDRIIRSALAA